MPYSIKELKRNHNFENHQYGIMRSDSTSRKLLPVPYSRVEEEAVEFDFRAALSKDNPDLHLG